ncbi:Transcriptional regulator [Verrucomicrobia bacterium]|nr:Transcriptional regulator [Verrucomicrobiota bacterium]
MLSQATPSAAIDEEPPPDDPVRNRIVESASERFFAQGFRGVTMDDLATELGMSKKTLYQHFDAKRRLLDAVIEQKFRRVRQDLAAIRAARQDFPEALRQHLACLQRHTSEIQPPFIKDIRQEGPEVFQKVERLRRANIKEFFGDLMRQGRRAGFIRKDVPAHIIIEILLAAVQAIVNPARLEELDLTPRSGCGLITKVVLEGAIDPTSRACFKHRHEK